MNKLPNFKIHPPGEISEAFLRIGINNFMDAANFVAQLNYGRNLNKNDLKTVFTDNCGTCSTKHALLKKVADENGFSEIILFLGIFKMNARNTKRVAETLRKNNLEYLPEAHNYLKFGNTIFDFTTSKSKASDFENDLLFETEILPGQISDYKVKLHKGYLNDWIEQNPQLNLDLETLWAIREECIRDLS